MLLSAASGGVLEGVAARNAEPPEGACAAGLAMAEVDVQAAAAAGAGAGVVVVVGVVE